MPKQQAIYYCEALDQAKTKKLAEEICKEGGLPRPIHAPSATTAIIMAIRATKEGSAATIIGRISDLAPPVGINLDVWAESVVNGIRDRGFDFMPLDPEVLEEFQKKRKRLHAVIEEYHRATQLLDEEVNDRRIVNISKALAANGRKYGRPPYGYCVRDGELQLEKDQSAAIATIITMIRDGHQLSEIIQSMNEKFSKRKVKVGKRTRTKKQHWDYVKLRRIVDRIRLYCLGEYVAADGTKMIIRGLAFLPPEYADTVWPGRS